MNPVDEEARMWRDALQTDAPAPEPVDADTVWKAVAGELPPDILGPLVDRLATDPDLQQAWRLAKHMQQRDVVQPPVVPQPANRVWLGVATLVAVVLVAVLVLPSLSPDTSVQTRGDADITTPLANREAVPRDNAVLRWEHPEGSTATVIVRDATLEVLATSPPVTEGRWTVPEEALASLSNGALFIWQVDVVTDGITTSSPAFVQRVSVRD